MAKTIKNEYVPDYVPPPGETLLEVIETHHMTQAELAKRIGKTTKTISEIIKDKASITPGTALQLEKVFGGPASFWNNLETNYRDFLERQKEHQILSKHLEWIDKFPVTHMAKLGWIRRFKNKLEQLDELLKFFAVDSPASWDKIWCAHGTKFRQSPAFESDPGAVSAWLRKGELEAMKIETRPYDQETFQENLQEARRLTVEEPGVFVGKLVELCAAAGVAVVFVLELPKTRVSGATRWLTPHRALIQLSLRYKTNDHLWFSFFHEAAHILKHGKRDVFIENRQESHTQEEKEADTFAADFLIPRKDYNKFCSNGDFSANGVRSFANQTGVAPGIVVGRLQYDKKLAPDQLNGLKRRYEWSMN